MTGRTATPNTLMLLPSGLRWISPPLPSVPEFHQVNPPLAGQARGLSPPVRTFTDPGARCYLLTSVPTRLWREYSVMDAAQRRLARRDCCTACCPARPAPPRPPPRWPRPPPPIGLAPPARTKQLRRYRISAPGAPGFPRRPSTAAGGLPELLTARRHPQYPDCEPPTATAPALWNSCHSTSTSAQTARLLRRPT